MKHLRNKLLLIFFALSIIPILLIGVVSYIISTNTLLTKINNASLSTLEQITRNVDTKAEKVLKYMDILFTSDKIQQILAEVNFSRQAGDVFMAYYELDPLINSLFYRDDDVRCAVILPFSGGHYTYKGYIENPESVKDEAWFEGIVKKEGQVKWAGIIPNPDRLGNEGNVFIVGRVIKDTIFRKSINPLGVAILFLDNNFFTGIYEGVEIGPLDSIMIANEEGDLMAAGTAEDPKNLRSYPFGERILSESGGYFRQKVDGTDLMITFCTSKITGWKVVRTVPYNYFVREIRLIGWLTFAIAFLCLIVIWILAYLVAGRISRPVLRLVTAMRQLGDKNFDVTVPVETRDEVGLISLGFNSMAAEIKRLFSEVVEEEKEKRKMYLRLLQNQINPHFLYNTLSSIRFLASAEGSPRTAETILVLSRLLRNTINKVGKLISVAEEISNLQDYILIQQTRYMNRIKVSYNINEEVLSLKVPGMLLQPLVENSIEHGLSKALAKNGQECRIEVSSYIVDGQLFAEIKDNGIGMTEKQIIDVFKNSDQESRDDTDHIGIKNIHDRIRIRFGQQYGISIQSVVDGYTLVRLNLPVISDEEDKLVEDIDC